MKITTEAHGVRSWQVSKVLDVDVPEDNRERGVYYMPNHDETAAAAAEPFWNKAATELRKAAGADDAPCALDLSVVDGRVVATASVTKRF